MKHYSERELEDDYPVFWGYWYVIDGEPKQSPIQGTVAQLRVIYKCESITSCDTVKRELLLI